MMTKEQKIQYRLKEDGCPEMPEEMFWWDETAQRVNQWKTAWNSLKTNLSPKAFATLGRVAATTLLEGEVQGTFTDLVVSLAWYVVQDYGIEVEQVKSKSTKTASAGVRVKVKNADPEVRNQVLEAIMQNKVMLQDPDQTVLALASMLIS